MSLPDFIRRRPRPGARRLVAVLAAGLLAVTAAGAAAAAPAGPGVVPGGCPVEGVQPGIVALPAIGSVVPSSGPQAGGTTVTLYGVGFFAENAVYFGSAVVSTILSNTDCTMTVIAPASPVAGTVNVTIISQYGVSPIRAGDEYTYVAGPQVTGVAPYSGPQAGGTSVAVYGSGFTGAGAVYFGGVPAAAVSVINDSSLIATAPASASPGTVNITVAGPGGNSPTSPADQYTYVAAPAVTGVSPASGPPTGGTSVTITGSGFAGASAVDFGAAPATSFTVNSNGSITAIAPAGATSAVNVTVTTVGGTSATGAGDQYTYTAATATTLTTSANPSVVGEPVTVTATVTSLPSGSGTPGGTITFTVDGIAQAPVTLASGSASLSLSSLSIGAHTITAAYSGAADYTASTSAPLTQNVGPAATSTTVTSSVNPSVSGQSVTFTATVAATTGSGTPTGTITFTIDGIAQAPVALTSGSAALTEPGLLVGQHAVTATYSGDGTFTTSTSAALVQTVDQAGTTTTLASSANPSPVGQPGTITATVDPTSPGSGTPTGTVTFTVDGAPQAPVTLASGSASLSLAAFGAGAHTVTAAYSGDGDFIASTSAPLTQTITQATATVILTSSANPSVTGQNVTITAAVAPVAPASVVPTGTVTIAIDGVTQAPVTLASGSAIINLPALAVGSHSITATYSGDSIYATATAPALTQSVNQAATTTTLTSSVNPSATGQSVTFTATVVPVSPGAGTPTGQVVFTVDGTPQAPVTLASGSATLSLATLTPGSHTIITTYQGTVAYSASTSSALTQSVLPASVTTLTSSINPTVSGQNTTLTVTVKPATGTGTATGTVTFIIDGTAQAPVTLGSGKATLKTNALAAGTHTITATYSGSSTFAASTSTALTQTVNQATTNVTLSSSLNPSNDGQTVAFTAVVLPISPGTGTPTGTVTFTIDGVTQTPIALGAGSGKSATFKISTLTPGTHTIIATYSGDSNYTASTSAPLTETVN